MRDTKLRKTIKPKPGIYGIKINTSRSWYVGSAQNCRTRLSMHISQLVRNTHHIPELQEEYNKNKLENIVLVVFKYLVPPTDAKLVLEQEYITKLSTIPGLTILNFKYPISNVFIPSNGSRLKPRKKPIFKRLIAYTVTNLDTEEVLQFFTLKGISEALNLSLSAIYKSIQTQTVCANKYLITIDKTKSTRQLTEHSTPSLSKQYYVKKIFTDAYMFTGVHLSGAVIKNIKLSDFCTMCNLDFTETADKVKNKERVAGWLLSKLTT